MRPDDEHESTMKRIAFVTYRPLPRVTEDDGLALEPLCERGVAVDSLFWDDADVNLTDYDALVLRSCWDYHRRPDEFLQFLDRVEASGVRLVNPTSVVRWNLDKRYLRDLESSGLTIAPTRWLDKSAKTTLSAELGRSEWDRAVVKPVISASGYQTWLSSAENAEADETRFQDLLAGGGVMIQKFMEEVRAEGEWSLLFFDGHYSHAALKVPGTNDFRVQLEHGGQVLVKQPSPALVRQAESVLARVEGRCAYARVDCVESDGRLILMELELIEPFLFLHAHPSAPERFATAIAKALEG